MKVAKKALKWGFDLSASQFGEHRRRTKTPKLWILMYHRVLPKSDTRYALEEPGMVVTPETLDLHLRIIKKNFTVVSLSAWLQQAQQGHALPSHACAVTFDDGWRDNHEHALPLLKQHRVPATLFVVADKVGTDFRFWPNIISELVAQNSPTLAQHALFNDAAQLARNGFTRDGIAHVIDQLKAHSEAELFAALEGIGWQSAIHSGQPALMSWPQVKDMQGSGLIEIGSHTATHQRLSTGLNPKILEQEIAGSRTTLEHRMNLPVSLFCFPNGDYDSATLKRVQDTYKAAVTTQHGINRTDRLNRHELRRIPLHEDGSNSQQKFLSRLSGW
ncbi:MAG: polysaccharide deacetylase family protein [Natronospirillum sp.]